MTRAFCLPLSNYYGGVSVHQKDDGTFVMTLEDHSSTDEFVISEETAKLLEKDLDNHRGELVGYVNGEPVYANEK